MLMSMGAAKVSHIMRYIILYFMRHKLLSMREGFLSSYSKITAWGV